MCKKLYPLTPRLHSCVGSQNYKHLSQLLLLIWPVSALELWCPLLGVLVLLDLDRWVQLGRESRLSILLTLLMAQCQLAPCFWAGTLTVMTLMTWPAVIIFPWSPGAHETKLRLISAIELIQESIATLLLNYMWREALAQQRDIYFLSVLCRKFYWIGQWMFSLHLAIQ